MDKHGLLCKLTDDDVRAIEYENCVLRSIADRSEIVGDVIEPVNDIRMASRREKVALKRLESVV